MKGAKTPNEGDAQESKIKSKLEADDNISKTESIIDLKIQTGINPIEAPPFPEEGLQPPKEEGDAEDSKEPEMGGEIREEADEDVSEDDD